MVYYEIIVTSGTDSGTVIPDVGFDYTDKLNEINTGLLRFSGVGSVRRGLLTIGATVEIKRNGTRDFYGYIQTIDYMEAGTVVAHLTGQEIKMARENGTYASSPYSSTASATIAGDIIGESSIFTAGTVEAGYSVDFRIATSQSQWNALTNLINKTQQDIGVDYINTEIDVLDHKGTASPVATLNNGINIKNMRVTYGYPLGNSIEVFGKGDGTNQIKGTATDATSISAYGTIQRIVIDRSTSSTAEANRLASAELALTKDPTKIYDFDLINPYQDYVAGDHLYLNATDMGLSNEEVRIVGINRGERGGKEFMSVQVTNPEYKHLLSTRNQILAKIQKNQVNADSYMQGSGNTLTWGRGLNAKSGVPMKFSFYIPASFITDEVGNIRVNSMTVDYDVDPYNSQYGSSSFTGSDPQVQNTSGNTQPGVSGNSSNTQPSVSGNSSNTQPGVSGTSSTTQPDLDRGDSSLAWSGSFLGSDSDSSVSCSAGSWTTVCSVNTAGSNAELYANFYVEGNSGGPEDIQVRLRNTGVITGTDSMWGVYQDGFRDDSFVRNSGVYAGPDGSGDGILLQVYAHTGAITVGGYLYVYSASHEHSYGNLGVEYHGHGDGSYVAANHSHGDGSYVAANHLHADGTYTATNHGHPDGTYDINAADINHISIADGVSEGGSVNASEVDIYLDFWNGSSWVNKHSVLNTGKTIDSDVDITDSGTYPDAAGYWRIRIDPNHASADFVQGILKIKHQIDN